MGAPYHGYNALIYVGGTELVGGNAWTIDVNATAVATPQFGQLHTVKVAGPYEWSGSITAWDQVDESTIISAAIGGAAVALLIYPTIDTATAFYSGSAIFSGGSGGGTRAAVDKSGSFEGSTALTINGFS